MRRIWQRLLQLLHISKKELKVGPILFKIGDKVKVYGSYSGKITKFSDRTERYLVYIDALEGQMYIEFSEIRLVERKIKKELVTEIDYLDAFQQNFKDGV